MRGAAAPLLLFIKISLSLNSLASPIFRVIPHATVIFSKALTLLLDPFWVLLFLPIVFARDYSVVFFWVFTWIDAIVYRI